MKTIKIGYALTGSFCTFEKSLRALEELAAKGYDITPIMSENSYTMDTKFGKAKDFIAHMENVCGKKVIHTIVGAEPIGPTKMFDLLIISPCTSNTAAKIALGINDTTVTMAAKSHMRNQRPVLIGISTNDALANSAKNIGYLQNMKNLYFIPYGQDNQEGKPFSMVCDFDQTDEALSAALAGKQLQPMTLPAK